MHGQPPPYAYPPPGWQPPPPPKRSWPARHKILTGIGVVVALGIIGGLFAPDPAPTGTTTAAATTSTDLAETVPGEKPPPATPATERTPRLGQPARDGQYEFVVQKTRCGVTRVGPELLEQKAQGQFCLITVKVTNVGADAGTFDASSQHATDAAGRTFDADSTASMYANDNGETFLNDINPGNSIVAVLVFDVPKAAALTGVELHDSPLSGGVTIALS